MSFRENGLLRRGGIRHRSPVVRKRRVGIGVGWKETGGRREWDQGWGQLMDGRVFESSFDGRQSVRQSAGQSVAALEYLRPRNVFRAGEVRGRSGGGESEE